MASNDWDVSPRYALQSFSYKFSLFKFFVIQTIYVVNLIDVCPVGLHLLFNLL